MTITDVRIPWAAAAGYVDKEPVELTYGTLNLPAIQLVFANFYLGIAQGGLKAATAYTRRNTRAWPYGGDDKQHAHEEWYVLEGYGRLQSQVWAAEALADAAGAEISGLLHAEREALTPEQRDRGNRLLSELFSPPPAPAALSPATTPQPEPASERGAAAPPRFDKPSLFTR